MSKYDGITRSRNKVETYKGFSIIRVLAVHHWYNNYQKRYEMSSQYETKREIYYEFCKEGDENRPSCAYNVTAKKDEIKGCIDNFIEDDSIYFTDAEREKYVKQPNRKCDYAYGYNSLMKIMREHQKAPKRIKILLEDRLEDANFHNCCGLLAEERYEEFEKHVTETYKFPEKFEVYTRTMRKRIKDPKGLTEGLNKVIIDYLAIRGIKDTSVEVRLCEEW